MINSLGMLLSITSHKFSLLTLVTVFEESETKIISFSLEEKLGSCILKIQFIPGDMGACLASLRRYEYEILELEGGDIYLEQLQDNANYLNTFLNI